MDNGIVHKKSNSDLPRKNLWREVVVRSRLPANRAGTEELKDQIKELCIRNFALNIGNAEKSLYCRFISEISTSSGPQPLLIVMSIHPVEGDGCCLALLSPDASLLGENLIAAVHSKEHVMEIIKGKCDRMLYFLSSSGGSWEFDQIYGYKNPKPQPARFKLS